MFRGLIDSSFADWFGAEAITGWPKSLQFKDRDPLARSSLVLVD
jgi:hypothetical protein